MMYWLIREAEEDYRGRWTGVVDSSNHPPLNWKKIEEERENQENKNSLQGLSSDINLSPSLICGGHENFVLYDAYRHIRLNRLVDLDHLSLKVSILTAVQLWK